MKQAGLTALLFLCFAACTFDYSAGQSAERTSPDMIMRNIEYVRVERGDPLVRFTAEYAERWEDSQIMELSNFSFEQFEEGGSAVNAQGRGAAARVRLETGDISISGGVRINIDAEDITIRTSQLDWYDRDMILSGAEREEVEVERSDGTSFLGLGFRADARNRTWEFSSGVAGRYVEPESDGEDGEVETDDREALIQWEREDPYRHGESQYIFDDATRFELPDEEK